MDVDVYGVQWRTQWIQRGTSSSCSGFGVLDIRSRMFGARLHSIRKGWASIWTCKPCPPSDRSRSAISNSSSVVPARPALGRCLMAATRSPADGMMLQVKDLPARISELKNEGVSFRNEMEVGPGGRQIQVEDPDENPIELFEPAR